MIKNKIFILEVASFLLVSSCFSQSANDYLKTADKSYKDGNYYNAIVNYEKGLNIQSANSKTKPYIPTKTSSYKLKNKQLSEIEYKLAESYRIVNDFKHAGSRYEQVLRKDSTSYPLAVYWYGVTLRANKEFEKAETIFQKFITTNKGEDAYIQSAKMELLNLQFIRQQLMREDQELFSVDKLNISEKISNGNYAPVLIDTTLFFTSTQVQNKANKPLPALNSLYKATVRNIIVDSTIEQLQIVPGKNVPQIGAACFSSDGKKVFFTQWTENTKTKNAAIYTSEFINNVWSTPVKLNDNINVAGYNSMQPFITDDNKYLVFSSNMPGGFGNYDLWYAELDNSGTLQKAVNLGTVINTKENEEAPYYHSRSKTLIFSTNGRVGMGGYDLFQSQGNFLSWQEPENLGYPINSTKDDIYFSSNKNDSVWRNAYISSDRMTDCCLEIFYVHREFKEYKLHITGTVTDCETNNTLANGSVLLRAKENLSVTTTINGTYSFDLVSPAPSVFFQYSKDQYKNKTDSFFVGSVLKADSNIIVNICLIPIKEEVTQPVKETISQQKKFTVYFAFNKAELTNASFSALDSLATLLTTDPQLIIEVGGYTDGLGKEAYNLQLGEQRAESCIKYLVKKGIDPSRLIVKSYGECCPVEPEVLSNKKDNPAGRILNRRVEFKTQKKE